MHLIKDNTKAFIQNGRLHITSPEFKTSFDVCMVYDMMQLHMAVNSKSPSIKRRARKLNQFYPNDVAPGPFTAQVDLSR